MLLDLHIEGSAPVTLLVRDESRSTRSTSGCPEDDQKSEENLAHLGARPKRRVHNVHQVLDSTIGDDSFDVVSMTQETKRRKNKHSHPTKPKKKKINCDEVTSGDLEASVSISSSRSSLFLDSFHSVSEKGDINEKENRCSQYESKSRCSTNEYMHDSENEKSSISSMRIDNKGKNYILNIPLLLLSRSF